MKLKYLFILFSGILAGSCSSNSQILIEVVNLSNQQRNDATILLTREDIAAGTDIPDGKLPVIEDKKGNLLASQVDDVNGDGEWDELFTLLDMAPHERAKLVLRFVDSESYPKPAVRTNLRLGDASKPGYPDLTMAMRLEGISYHNYSHTTDSAYQMEGPAWENDRVGFRNYLDQRNGFDIFGKLTDQMVLDSVGTKYKSSYHEPAEWGMDVLKVGTSLGAGGIGYMYKDSIYRVGDSGSGTYELLFEGSLRSRFKLTYSMWEVDGSVTEVTQQIQISAGKHCYQSGVSYSGNELELDLVVGIVNMKSAKLHVLKLGNFHTALITHDLQAEDTTMLAMALLVPNEYLLRTGETPAIGDGIIQTYYAVLDAMPGDLVPYRFYALWEKEDPRWSSFEEVVAFMEEEAARWTQSVAYKLLH